MPVNKPLKSAFASSAEQHPSLGYELNWFPIQDCLNTLKAFVCRGTQPPESADATESFGQDVLQETANKLDSSQPERFLQTRAAFSNAEYCEATANNKRLD